MSVLLLKFSNIRSNGGNKNNALSLHFQNPIQNSQKEVNGYYAHMYLTAYIPGLVQALQLKVAGSNYFYVPNV